MISFLEIFGAVFPMFLCLVMAWHIVTQLNELSYLKGKVDQLRETNDLLRDALVEMRERLEREKLEPK